MASILLVDENPARRLEARMALEGAGYIVCEARSGTEALSLQRWYPQQVIVYGTGSRPENALATLQALRSEFPKLPLIVCTALASTLEPALRAGATVAISEPMSVHCLVGAVREVLRTRQLPASKRDTKLSWMRDS